MKDSDRYVKIVEWSDEDQCYVENALDNAVDRTLEVTPALRGKLISGAGHGKRYSIPGNVFDLP